MSAAMAEDAPNYEALRSYLLARLAQWDPDAVPTEPVPLPPWRRVGRFGRRP